MPYVVINKKSLEGGLSKNQFAISNSQDAAENQYVRSDGIDLSRVNREGHITPAQIFDLSSYGATNAAINSLPRAVTVGVPSATPLTFYILSGASGTAPKVVWFNDSTFSGSFTISAHASNNFTSLPSPGTGYWGEDIIFYRAKNGSGTLTDYIFYSWNDTGSPGKGDVGRCLTDGTGQDDDFMSTEPASGGATLTPNVPHRMIEHEGSLWITNGQYLAEYDGSNGSDGTLNATRFDFGAGWVLTDIRKYQNYLAVSMTKMGSSYIVSALYDNDSRVCFITGTETFGQGIVYPILDNHLRALFSVSGMLFAFTEGKNSSTKLRQFNGQSFEVIWEGGTDIYATPDPRSIEFYKDLLCWVSLGNIVAYDPLTKGVHMPFIINDGTTAATNPSGLLKNLQQGILYVGGLFGATYKVVTLTAGGDGYGSTARNLRTRRFLLPYKASITSVRIWFSQLASGGSAQFSIFKNYTNSSVGTAGTDLLNKTYDFATYGALTEKHIDDISITDVSSFYMNIRVTGQVSVAQIEVEYQPSQKQTQ